jgi:hypothetical protein
MKAFFRYKVYGIGYSVHEGDEGTLQEKVSMNVY